MKIYGEKIADIRVTRCIWTTLEEEDEYGSNYYLYKGKNYDYVSLLHKLILDLEHQRCDMVSNKVIWDKDAGIEYADICVKLCKLIQLLKNYNYGVASSYQGGN